MAKPWFSVVCLFGCDDAILFRCAVRVAGSASYWWSGVGWVACWLVVVGRIFLWSLAKMAGNRSAKINTHTFKKEMVIMKPV
jgi:hypothetical protein